MTREDVVALIRELIENEGTQAYAAKVIGVSQQYLNDILKRNREPGPAILNFFGIERDWIYRRK